MGYTFNGSTKIVSLTSGTTILDVRDIYSRWKDWVISDGANFLPAFQVVGGDPIDEIAGVYVTSYFFLTNGWRIRPQEANHKLNVVNGILLTIEGTDPFLSTLGTYNVLVLYSQPIKSETVSTGGGGATPAQIWSYTDRTLTDGNITSINKMVSNKVSRSGDTITIYEDDGVTVWRQYDLADGGRSLI
jgi:hypothetical protein